MGRRRKWYESAILEYLSNGGADGIGCATSRQIQEMLHGLGRRQVPRVGAISQTLRGIFDSQRNKLVIQVGVAKVARGESRVRGYDVAVWCLSANPHMDRAIAKYTKKAKED